MTLYTVVRFPASDGTPIERTFRDFDTAVMYAKERERLEKVDGNGYSTYHVFQMDITITGSAP